jgi:hypothetical protein
MNLHLGEKQMMGRLSFRVNYKMSAEFISTQRDLLVLKINSFSKIKILAL